MQVKLSPNFISDRFRRRRGSRPNRNQHQLIRKFRYITDESSYQILTRSRIDVHGVLQRTMPSYTASSFPRVPRPWLKRVRQHTLRSLVIFWVYQYTALPLISLTLSIAAWETSIIERRYLQDSDLMDALRLSSHESAIHVRVDTAESPPYVVDHRVPAPTLLCRNSSLRRPTPAVEIRKNLHVNVLMVARCLQPFHHSPI